jgi:hypothetical protein
VIVFVHFRFSFVQKRESQQASGRSELRESQQVSGLTEPVGRRQGEWRTLGAAQRRRANGRMVNTWGRQVCRCVSLFFLSGGRFS